MSGAADPEEVVRALLGAFSARDADALVGLTTDDVVFEPASTEVAKRSPYVGHEGLRAYIRDLARDWDEFDVTVAEVRVGPEGHFVALGRAYARAGGKIADGPVAFVFALAHGLVRWGKTYTDRTEALRLAGLM